MRALAAGLVIMCGACGPALAGIMAAGAQQGSAVEPIRAGDLLRAQAAWQTVYAGGGQTAGSDDLLASVSGGRFGAGERVCEAGGMTYGYGLYADLKYGGDVVRWLRRFRGNRMMGAARAHYIALN